jgi:superfamily II DNA or RNA helicase
MAQERLPPAVQAGGQAVSECADEVQPTRNTAPSLWPYQSEAIEAIYAATATHRRICLVAPTGSGKTHVAVALIKQGRLGRHALFVDHRRELTEQTSRKLYHVGVEHGILQAGFPTRPTALVQIASIQTLHARAVQTSRIELPPADLLIIDEAHHARARTYERLIAAYPRALIVGLTATPCRADGRGLGNIFEHLVECPSIAELTRLKFLVPVTTFAPSRPDLTGVRIERGDYVESQLAQRVNTVELVGDIVEHWHRLGEGRRTVIFTVNVAHSVHIRDEFRRSGVLAEHVDGSTPLHERKRILAAFAAGNVQIVCNCAVLVEGWDQPEASCLVLARPTRSLGLYRQMVGRVLRLAPGKVDAIVLDHAGAVFLHGFVDDEISWTLHQDERAQNVAQAQRSSGAHTPALTTCPKCSAVRLEGRPCSVCGWYMVRKPVPMEIAAGELGRVDRDRSVRHLPQDQLGFYRQLMHIAVAKRWKSGAAAHWFKEKFGRFPPWNWNRYEPEPPEAATIAWVRSRNIAYAKGLQARGR